MVVSGKTKTERYRCYGIVRDRRAMVERKLVASLTMSTYEKKVVRRVIALLEDIESKILDMPEVVKPETVQYAGDFSVEEMERAQAIIEEQEHNIEEQEHNPFEG